jgi:dTDP-4-amino-4,6-dideoxygalactose transaminase
MAVLDERIAQRRANFQGYQNYFKDLNMKGFNIRFQEEAEHSFSNRWLSCIYIDPSENKGIDREKIRLALEVDNIEARPLWKPMHLQPVFADCKYYGSNVCETLFENGLCLPSGSNLTEEDFTRIFSALDQIFK